MRWYHKALAWAGVLLTAVAFPGSGWAAAKAPTLTPITIAQTSNALGWAADYLALVNGDFRREGLDVRLLVMNGDAEALPAVIAGDAQFGAITTISTMEAIAKGQDLKIIAPFTDQFVAQFIIRKSLVKKLGITASMPMDEKMRRIKGLIVGTPDVGGSFQLLFNGLAKMAGLDPNKDFTVTAIHPYPAELDALKRGQIDVGIFPIPYGDIAVKAGYAAMLANFWAGGVPQFSGAIHQSMIVTGSYAKAHPAVVAAVRRALALALAEIHRQPALAVRTLEKVYPKTNPAIIRQIVVNEGVGYPAGATISRRGFDIVRDFTARYVDPAAAKIRYRDAVWPAAQVR